MKARELELCEIQNWYPCFETLSLKTIIHPLPEPFIAYLEEDGLFLHRNSEALPARPTGLCEDEDYRRWDEEDDEADEPTQPSFPDLEEQVTASIGKLGGSVFPKLNWSAPKDSAWISSHGNLKCTNFGEICLLLKASDSLVHDLSHAFDSCEDKMSHRPKQFFLAIRKWYDLRPEMEFRGFVKGGLLVGVCQREVTGFYPAVVEALERLDNSVFQFFVHNISESFDLSNYTFDCYVTRSGKVKLIDFNPWGAFTLPLLFTWDELESIYEKAMAVSVSLSSWGDCDEADSSSAIAATTSSDCVMNQEDGGGFVSPLPEMDNNLNSVNALGNTSLASRSSEMQSNSNATTADAFIDGGRGNLKSSIQEESGHQVNNSKTHVTANAGDGIERMIEEKNGSSTRSDHCLATMDRKRANIAIREQGFKVDFRVVQSSCHVQINMRVGGGVPYDYVQTGAGSAWDEFLRRAGEEMQQQNKDVAAGA